MKKKDAIRIISLSLIAVIFSVGFAVKSEIQNQKYKYELETGYSRSLDELNSAINNISVTLSKAKFVTTPKQISSIAAKLLSEAELSKNALAQLPAGNELTQLNRFLSQVGNYALSVSKTLISGETLSPEHMGNIEKLSTAAEKISQLVSDSQISYNNTEYWAKELDGKIDENIDDESLASSLGEIEESLSDYPKLVYDGPFSDHILEKEPTLLKNAETISQNEAHEIANSALGSDEKETKLEYDGSVLGSIPSYRFAGDGITVTVSRAGGYIVYLRRERVVGENILSHQQAIEKAKRYLKNRKLDNFKETYYFTNEGICVINFAFTDGKTICYTDLIKVGVAMDTGEIMLYEASGYISNHTDRAFSTPAHTIEEAKKIISPKLTVKSTALALIPTSGKNEARCYEFTCSSADGQEILIYINTSTLDEEDVLILLKSDGGTLVK